MLSEICLHPDPAGVTSEAGEITELVRGNEQILLDRMMPMVRTQNVTLDLSTVERIDAAGLAALIALYCEACKAGHRMAVTHPSRHVQEILALVGLDSLLVAEPDPTPTFGTAQLQASAA